MIMKKQGGLFCDAYYFHVCGEKGDKNDERIIFDDLRDRWQFCDGGFEMEIDFCPFCGKALREIRPKGVLEEEEDVRSGRCEEEHTEVDQQSFQCSVKCMFCSEDVTLQIVPENEGCRSGECNHCRAKVEFDIFR